MVSLIDQTNATLDVAVMVRKPVLSSASVSITVDNSIAAPFSPPAATLSTKAPMSACARDRSLGTLCRAAKSRSFQPAH